VIGTLAQSIRPQRRLPDDLNDRQQTVRAPRCAAEPSYRCTEHVRPFSARHVIGLSVRGIAQGARVGGPCRNTAGTFYRPHRCMFPPFWTGAPHIVHLRAIGVGERTDNRLPAVPDGCSNRSNARHSKREHDQTLHEHLTPERCSLRHRKTRVARGKCHKQTIRIAHCRDGGRACISQMGAKDRFRLGHAP
jgi:hypothetical protein